jgi:hypothetical protein
MPLGLVGCYVDKPDRILSNEVADNKLNTGDSCKQQCKNAGYRYAGTQVKPLYHEIYVSGGLRFF